MNYSQSELEEMNSVELNALIPNNVVNGKIVNNFCFDRKTLGELVGRVKQLGVQVKDYSDHIEFALGGKCFSVFRRGGAIAEVIAYILISQHIKNKSNKKENLEGFSELFFTDVSEVTNIPPAISKGDKIKVELEGGVVAYCEVKKVVSND